MVTRRKETEGPIKEREPLNDDQVLYSAYEQARIIIEEAKKSAEELIEQRTEALNQECLSEKDAARKEGFEQGLAEGVVAGRETGYQEGYQQGTLQAEESNREYVEGVLHVIDCLEETKKQVIEEQHNNLTVLAVSIAERILGQTLNADDTKMCAVIEQALEQYQQQEWLNCYFSYDFLDALKTKNGEIFEKLQQISKGIRFLPSKELEDTDCIIELPAAVMDIGIDAQMNKIKKVLSK
jgi:flagellar assembly protein FliH